LFHLLKATDLSSSVTSFGLTPTQEV